MKSSIKALLVVLIVVLSTNCTKDEDRTSPLVDIATPAIAADYIRGGNIYFNAIFTDDDSGLKECIVSLSHLKATRGWEDPWMPEEEIISLSGKKQELDQHIIFNQSIPFDVMSGYYVLNIRVVDNAGNISQYSRNFNIE